jgi:hypothetical protein
VLCSAKQKVCLDGLQLMMERWRQGGRCWVCFVADERRAPLCWWGQVRWWVKGLDTMSNRSRYGVFNISPSDVKIQKLSHPDKGKLRICKLCKIIHLSNAKWATFSHDNVGINNQTFIAYLFDMYTRIDQCKVKVMVIMYHFIIYLSYVYKGVNIIYRT